MAQIDHIGIAVKSLAAATAIYEKLGLIRFAGRDRRAGTGAAGDGSGGREPVGIVGGDVREFHDREIYCQARRRIASRLPARSGFASGRCAIEDRRRATGLGRNQDRCGWSQIRVRASSEHRWSVAGTGRRIESGKSSACTDLTGIQLRITDASSRNRHFRQTGQHCPGASDNVPETTTSK